MSMKLCIQDLYCYDYEFKAIFMAEGYKCLSLLSEKGV